MNRRSAHRIWRSRRRPRSPFLDALTCHPAILAPQVLERMRALPDDREVPMVGEAKQMELEVK